MQIGAFLLALNAGMVNVLGLIMVLHQSVSHMTGNVSMVAIALSHLDFATFLYPLCVILFFVLGSFYSGYILGDGQLAFGRRYGIPLLLVSLSIVLCWLFLPYFPRYGLLWAATAMGLQNAMVSHYRGVIIRTTHLSGVLTDIGLSLGYLVRGLKIDLRRLVLHLMILLGFIIGGILASIFHHFWQVNAFLVPALLSISLSIMYWYLYLTRS